MITETEREDFEKTLQALSFASALKWRQVVAQIDLSTVEQRALFAEWDREDGTRAGLVKYGLLPAIHSED